jgi:acetylornithine/succinyldiaminopimelate/putrescine aminotransferase
VLEQGEACAFILEPIQAEGGIIVPPDGYLAGLRELCDRTGTILIYDEVQTGVGRTGEWFGHQHDGVAPDVMTMAKALGGGVPIGAVAASEKAAQGLTFQEGGAVPHASTFGGNPLACAAANKVIEVIEAEGLLDNTREVGRYLGDQLDQLTERHELAIGTRGRGFLRGLVLDRPAAGVYRACRENGLLVSVAGGVVIRFAPALIAGRAHIDEAIEILDRVLGEAAS